MSGGTPSGGGGAEFEQMTSATTWNPTTQTGLTKVTIDLTDVTTGQVDVNVDSTSIINSESGITTRLINPSSSLSIVSSDIGYNVSNSTYDNSYSVYAQERYAHAVAFKTDGTKMYVTGDYHNKVREYSLSTAWDITTASYANKYFQANTYTHGIFWKPDGTKIYLPRATDDIVYEYSLSTAWNLSTLSQTNTLNVSSKDTNLGGTVLKSDGTELYAIGSSSDSIHQYTLSTAWDISTASFTQSYDVSSHETSPSSVAFSSNGKKFFIVGSQHDKVYQYSLGTAWDISTASYDDKNFSVHAQMTSPNTVVFNANGDRMYLTGYDGNVYQYDIDGSFSGTLRASVG